MRIRRFFVPLCLLLCFNSLAAAAPTEEEKILADVMKPTSGGAEQPAGKAGDSAAKGDDKGGGLWSLELEMAESRYRLSKTRETRAKLLSTYEKAINAVCLKDLVKDLDYKSSSDPRCQAYIMKMLQEVPGDPAALCARDGIDAPSCITAYSQQVVKSFDPIHEAKVLDLDGEVVEKRLELESKEWQALDKKLTDLVNHSTKQTINSLEIAQTLRKVLNITCRYSGEAYEVDAMTAPRHGSGLIQDDDSRLKHTLESVGVQDKLNIQQAPADNTIRQRRPGGPVPLPPAAAPVRAPIPVRTAVPKEDVSALVYNRFRYVPAGCQGYIDRARSAGISDWSMTCYHDGFLSPQCIRAMRSERKNPKVKKQDTANGAPGAPEKKKEEKNQGFSTF